MVESHKHAPPEPDPSPARPSLSPARWVQLALLFYGLLALLALAWRTGLAGEPLLFASPAAEAAGFHPLRDVGGGLAVALLMVAASRVLTHRTHSGKALARALAEALGPLSGGSILVLALASGIAEELFFRGALQPRVGLVAASLLFGLAHLVPARPLVFWSLFAVVAGLLFGGLFQTTGNLLAPIVAHTAINGVNLHWLVRRFGPAGAATASSSSPHLGSRN